VQATFQQQAVPAAERRAAPAQTGPQCGPLAAQTTASWCECTRPDCRPPMPGAAAHNSSYPMPQALQHHRSSMPTASAAARVPSASYVLPGCVCQHTVQTMQQKNFTSQLFNLSRKSNHCSSSTGVIRNGASRCRQASIRACHAPRPSHALDHPQTRMAGHLLKLR
jgi:hypothetical protein